MNVMLEQYLCGPYDDEDEELLRDEDLASTRSNPEEPPSSVGVRGLQTLATSSAKAAQPVLRRLFFPVDLNPPVDEVGTLTVSLNPTSRQQWLGFIARRASSDCIVSIEEDFTVPHLSDLGITPGATVFVDFYNPHSRMWGLEVAYRLHRELADTERLAIRADAEKAAKAEYPSIDNPRLIDDLRRMKEKDKATIEARSKEFLTRHRATEEQMLLLESDLQLEAELQKKRQADAVAKRTNGDAEDDVEHDDYRPVLLRLEEIKKRSQTRPPPSDFVMKRSHLTDPVLSGLDQGQTKRIEQQPVVARHPSTATVTMMVRSERGRLLWLDVGKSRSTTDMLLDKVFLATGDLPMFTLIVTEASTVLAAGTKLMDDRGVLPTVVLSCVHRPRMWLKESLAQVLQENAATNEKRSGGAHY